MDEGRTERARQILQAIDNGNLPVEETRRRLFAMLEEELAGPLDQDYDKVKVELCESLLWESMTDGETPLPDFERSKAAVAKKYEAKKRRGRILVYSLRVAVTVLLLLCVLLISAFALNSEFREGVTKLFVTTYETHSSVEMRTEDGENHLPGAKPVREYQLTWLPDRQYEVVERTCSKLTSSVTYASDDGAMVFLDIANRNFAMDVDTEGMTPSIVILDGLELHLFRGDESSIVIWQKEEICFVLDASGVTDAEILLMALSVTPLGE